MFQELFIRDFTSNEPNPLRCIKEGHQNFKIIRFCLKYGCDKPRKACSVCIIDHKDHFTDLFAYSFLCEVLQNEEAKLTRYIDNIKNTETEEMKTIIQKTSYLLHDLKIHREKLLKWNTEQLNETIKTATKCYANIFYQELLNVILSQNWTIQKHFLKQWIVQELDKIYNEENLDYLCQLMFQKGTKCTIKGITLLMIGKMPDTFKIFNMILSVKATPDIQNFKVRYLSIMQSLNQEQMSLYFEDLLNQRIGSQFFQFFVNDNFYGFYLLAYFQFKNQKYQESLNNLMKIPEGMISECASEIHIRKLFIMNLLCLKQYEEALVKCQSALKKNGTDQNLLFLQRICLTEQNKKNQKLLQIENDNNDDDHVLYNQAIFLLNQNRIEEAFKLFDQIQPWQRNYNTAQVIKGDILLNQNKNNQAIEQYKRVNDMRGNTNQLGIIKNVSELGQKLANCLSLEEQLQSLHNNQNLRKNNYQFMIFKCMILSKHGKYQEIQEILNLALKQYPEKLVFYNMKTISLVQLQRFSEALEIIEQVLEKNQDLFYWLRLKGKVLYFQRRIGESIAMYKQICSLFDSRIEAYFEKGVILKFEDNDNESLKSFEKVLTIDPNFTPAIYNKGIILSCLNRDNEALQLFQTIFDFRKSKLLYVQIQIKNKQLNEALIIIQQFQSNQKYQQRLQIFKYQILLKQKNFQQAYETVKKVDKNKLKWYLWYQVYPLCAQNKFEQAQSLIDSELAIAGENIFVQITQGELLSDKGLFSQALIWYNKALLQYESSPLKQTSNTQQNQSQSTNQVVSRLQSP